MSSNLRTLRAPLLAVLFATSAVALVPPAAADHIDPLCNAFTDPTGCEAAHCENPWAEQTGAGVVPMTIHFIGDEYAIVCDWTMAQPVVVGFIVLATCNNTVDYLAGGHCDGWVGPYEPGPLYCQPPAPSGGGLLRETIHYAEVEAYILCLAASMEGGVSQDLVVDSCNNAGQYLFGRDMCFVI